MRPPAVHTGPTTPFGGVGCTWVVVRAVRTVEVCQQQVSSRVQCLGGPRVRPPFLATCPPRGPRPGPGYHFIPQAERTDTNHKNLNVTTVHATLRHTASEYKIPR